MPLGCWKKKAIKIVKEIIPQILASFFIQDRELTHIVKNKINWLEFLPRPTYFLRGPITMREE